MPYYWEARQHQKKLWRYLSDGGKRAIEIAHRRWGKDDVALHHTACAVMERQGSYIHCLPEYAQARKAIWTSINPHSGLRRIDEAFPVEIRENVNEQEMFIRFKNGSTWQVVGSDNYNSLVGTSYAGIVFSEWALANASAWGYFEPILRENEGWALFITTPRGRNHALHMLNHAKISEAWFWEVSTANDTGMFDAAELAEILKENIAIHGEAYGNAIYGQEYLCSFDSAIAGAIFGAEMTAAENSGRLNPNVKPVAGYKVHTAWDLGNRDSHVIIFFQILPDRINVIDCYAAHYKSFEHYADMLKSKGYDYGYDFLPHDAVVFESGTGRTRIEQLMLLGRRCKLVVRHRLEDGIAACRSTLARTWINSDECATLIEAMRSFHRDYDDDKRVFMDAPVHDWSSDYAAAFRYMAMAWKERQVEAAEEKLQEGLTAVDKYGRQQMRIDLLKRLNKKARDESY